MRSAILRFAGAPADGGVRIAAALVLGAALALTLGCDPGSGPAQAEASAPAALSQDGGGTGGSPPAVDPRRKTPGPQTPQSPQSPQTPGPVRPGFEPRRATSEPPTGPQPRIVFKEKQHDFKTVVFGEVVDYKFEFENTGDAELVIDRVQPSCGCVAAPLQKKNYKPGEKGEIEISFDTSKKTPSFHRLTVAVHSNDWHEKDRNSYVSVLQISGDVIVFFKSLPMQYVFSNIPRGAPTSSVLTLFSTGETGETLEVDRIEVSNPRTMVAELIQPSSKAGTGNFGPDAVDIKLTLTPDRIGSLLGKVTVHTKSEKQPMVVLNVRGSVTGDITVDRRIIYVSNYIKGRPLVPNQFRITRRPGQPLEILGVETTEGLIATPKEFTKDRIYVVNLSLDPRLPARPFAGEVKVFVNSEDQPMIQVPVVVYMKPSISVNPDSVYFERSLSAGNFSQLITVTGPHGYPFDVSLEEEGKAFDIEVRPPAEKNRPAHVLLKLKAGATPGPIAEDVVLKTNVLGEERVVIPVRAKLLE